MAASVTVPCDCCKNDEDRQCYEITGWSATPIGSPGCTTTAELQIVRRYIETPGRSPTPSEVRSAIDGAFSVDCSTEPSGFCRNRGADGMYPWTSAVFEGVSDSSDPDRLEQDFQLSYTYLFEDCQLGEADLQVAIGIRYLGLGACPGI